MSCNMSVFMKVLATSVVAASRAGKIVRDVMKKGELGIVEKGINDYQTEADRSAQRCIIASLAEQYPKMTIIGEEGISDLENIPSEWLISSGDEDVLSHTCPNNLTNVKEEDIVVWVDPLDGTSEYTQGALMLKRPPWERWKTFLQHPFISTKWYMSLMQADYGFLEHVTVLIGISVNEEPVGGVIHQPFYKIEGKPLGRTIWGARGIGVKGIDVTPPPRELIVTTTRSHSNPNTESALVALKPDQILRVGGAGFKVLQLIEGKASVYVFASSGCKKWDTCAPEAILLAAGGKLTDICGRRYKYGANVEHVNSAGVLAAVTEQLHMDILDKISADLKERFL